MLPISFSSFGDIVTAADLALRIAKALSDSTGSAFEYQCLVNELHSLSYVLKLADCAVKSTALRQDIRHGIDSEIARCRDIMDTLSNKVKKYQKMLGYGVGSSWMKIGWGLFETAEIEEFRKKISRSRELILMFLMSCNIAAISDLSADATRMDMWIKVRLNEIYTIVRHLPRSMGYTQENAIELLDVLGRKLVLPMELCFTWEQFDATLKVYFTNRAGQRFVDRGQYEMSRRGEKDVIDPRRWSDAIRTGLSFDMSIVLRQASDRMRGNEVRQCPRCHHDNTALALNAGEWVECRYCGGRYQISEVEQQEVEDSSGDHPAATENGPGDESDDHTLEIQDMRLFRSIHVLTSVRSHEEFSDIIKTIIANRKTWRVAKHKNEVVWPSHLEAALIEGRGMYHPSGPTTLERPSKRNRFIADHIYHKTGHRRTPKQVGARLQQLRTQPVEEH